MSGANARSWCEGAFVHPISDTLNGSPGPHSTNFAPPLGFTSSPYCTLYTMPTRARKLEGNCSAGNTGESCSDAISK